MQPSIAVVGAGPGIGLAVARRFCREGFAVALIARRQDAVDGYAAELRADGGVVLGVAANAADPSDLEAAWATVVAEIGDPAVAVYNAAAYQPSGPPTTLAIDDLVATFRVNVAGALLTARLAAPALRAAGQGTMLFTGGGLSLEPMARAAALSIGKAGIRSLALTLAEELAPEGIHVATVTVCGAVAPGTHFDPDVIVEEYWKLHLQPPPWTTEIVFD